MYVILVHPNLPGRELPVRPLAVYHYERSGWRRPKAAKTRRPEPVEPPVEEKPAE